MDSLSYYKTQSPFTDPGDCTELVAAVPASVPEICGVIQGLFLDYRERYKYPIVNERLLITNSRYVQKVIEQVEKLKKGPLTEEREIPDRFLANSSDYANLFCGIARYNGIAARKRVGFDGGRTFELAEYWDEKKKAWIQVDPSGLAEGEFVSAADAWEACRSGAADPDQFKGDGVQGLEAVRANLILDLAAMNKIELLNWDRYGWMMRPFSEFSDRAWETLDKVAALLKRGDQALEEIQALYNSEEGIQVPRIIKCDSPVVPPHKVELTF